MEEAGEICPILPQSWNRRMRLISALFLFNLQISLWGADHAILNNGRTV
jgi:hypothetical protein